MAADQRKKRLNGVSVVGYSLRDQHKAKKKKLVLPRYDSSVRSSISLEWDEKRKSVVAKREQIGIAHRDLLPFLSAVPDCHNMLADIVSVPQETFELENLNEVLSSEVWQTHLSENDRNYLSQFLPKGVEARTVVQELLAGDNFHFGNSFLKWGSSLCSGDLHPDTVLKKEHVLKATKKAYYTEIQNYHHDMIENLQKLKERWANCKDPVTEIGQNLWRWKKHSEKIVAAHANDYRLGDFDNNLSATSESCSTTSDDKACSSDELNSSLYEDSQTRKGSNNASDRLKVLARAKKGEKLQKRNVQFDDGAKYMSYIKVSKKQHERVKSNMKHSSNSIQPRSLNHVLGDLDSFCVRPYRVFEEEERKKLHEHWSKLANRDVAAGFANWRRKQTEKFQLVQALGQEMTQKLNYIKEDEEIESPNKMLGDQVDNGASDLEPSRSSEDEEKEIPDSLFQEQMETPATNHESSIALEDRDSGSPIFQQQAKNEAAISEPVMEEDINCVSTYSQDLHLQQNTLIDHNRVFPAMNLASDENHVPKLDALPQNVSEYSGNLCNVDVPLVQDNPLTVASDIWASVGMPSSYYHRPPANHKYMSTNDFSHRHQQVIEQPVRLIDLEHDMQKVDPRKDLLCGQPEDQFFSPYPNQVQNEQYPSLFKSQGSLGYRNEQKPATLDVQPPVGVMIEDNQFVGHFREQLNPSMALDLGQKRLKDPYMHQNIQENIYSDGFRYAIPRQEHFSPINMQDWGANAVQLSGPPQSHLSGGELPSQNWFSGQNQARGGWSNSEGSVCPNQSTLTGCIADQSLFGVLSQSSELRPGAPYNSLGSHERFNQSGNYNGMGGGVPVTSNLLPRTVNPLNYISGHEAANDLRTSNNIGWVSRPHQNTVLRNSMGKPYMMYRNHQ